MLKLNTYKYYEYLDEGILYVIGWTQVLEKKYRALL